MVTLLLLSMIISLIVPIISDFFWIIILVLHIKVGIGRMKDRWKNPWNLLRLFVPLINLICAIRLLFNKGTVWPNKYGPDVDGDYRKAGWVKRYYWIVQILVFLGLFVIAFFSAAMQVEDNINTETLINSEISWFQNEQVDASLSGTILTGIQNTWNTWNTVK